MMQLVNTNKPDGYASFTASNRWRINFFNRFKLSIRVTTNSKSQTVEDRLPLVEAGITA